MRSKKFSTMQIDSITYTIAYIEKKNTFFCSTFNDCESSDISKLKAMIRERHHARRKIEWRLVIRIHPFIRYEGHGFSFDKRFIGKETLPNGEVQELVSEVHTPMHEKEGEGDVTTWKPFADLKRYWKNEGDIEVPYTHTMWNALEFNKKNIIQIQEAIVAGLPNIPMTEEEFIALVKKRGVLKE